MPDQKEDLEVPETEEQLGFHGPGKGAPVTIITNEDVWLVLGPKRLFKVLRLKAKSKPTTIMPEKGKVGIVTERTGDQPGKREFTVELYKVDPKNDSELEVRAKETIVTTRMGDEKRVEFSLIGKYGPLTEVLDTYDENKCKTKADITKDGVGIAKDIVGATANVASKLVAGI